MTAGAYPVTVTPEWTSPPTSTPTTSNQAPYTNAVTETGAVSLGTSVTGVTVTPTPILASTSATYTVGFESTSGVSAGGYICLSELSTSFANSLPSTASPTLAVLLTDTTSLTHFVLPSADVGDVACGTSTLDVNSLQIILPTGEIITPGDQVTVTLINVNNPTAVGTYSDFAVSTSMDPVAVDAPAYQIAVAPGAPIIGTAAAGYAQATVSFSAPTSNGASAISSYTVTATDSTTFANGGQTASGTASPITVTGLSTGDSYSFTVTATNGAGTGPASAASNAVVPAAPSPPPASPAPIATPTTTTTVPTTTTTSTTPTSPTTTVVTTTTTRPPGPKVPKAVIALNRQAAVSGPTARLRLTCTKAACSGTITLWYHNVRFATTAYHLAPGKGHTFSARLSARAMRLLGEAKGHVLEVDQTVTVKGGATIKARLELGR